MKMDEFPVLGHQMTHSIDSYITDSANSASALYSGHKSTVNAMGYVFICTSIQTTTNISVFMPILLLILSMTPRSRPLSRSSAASG